MTADGNYRQDEGIM